MKSFLSGGFTGDYAGFARAVLIQDGAMAYLGNELAHAVGEGFSGTEDGAGTADATCALLNIAGKLPHATGVGDNEPGLEPIPDSAVLFHLLGGHEEAVQDHSVRKPVFEMGRQFFGGFKDVSG